MLGSRRRIGDKNLLILRYRIPENLGDIPRPVAIMDDQPVSLSLEFAMGAKQGFRRRPLKKGPRLRIYGRTQEIIGGGIADVELDGWVEFHQFDKIGFEKGPFLARRLRSERLCTQFFHGMDGGDPE